MAKKIKTGIFGGSFNPVHIGHLRAAEEVREQLSLDKVLFIPSSVHPIKKERNIPDGKTRLKMLQLAVSGNAGFEVSDIELKRKGVSYTVDTLKQLKKENRNEELYFIVGTENLAKIDEWKDYKDLFNLAHFAVIARPGFIYKNIRDIIPGCLRSDINFSKDKEGLKVFKHTRGKEVIFLKIRGISISSTTLRKMIQKKRSIKYFVPDKLNNYIIKNNLYSGE